MQNVIVVRNLKTKSELFRHELSEGERPWEVLQTLMNQDFETEKSDLEYVMDLDREEREAAEKEAMKSIGQP